MKFIFIAVISVFAITDTLFVRYAGQEDYTKIGTLTRPLQKSQSPTLELIDRESIINRANLAQGSATLKLEGQNTLLTHIDARQLSQLQWKTPTQECLQLVVSGDELIAFDYVIKQAKKGYEPFVIIYKDQEEAPKNQVYVKEEKPLNASDAPTQPQGIIDILYSYKWYIIIGFIVFFMMSQSDPEKLNENIQQATQQAQQATGGGRRKK